MSLRADGAERTDRAHATAIEASLQLASERGGDLTARVYTLLFSRAPHMKTLFWRDKKGDIKGEMLSRVCEAILDFIGPRHYSDHLIRAEVLTHEGYDVPRDIFATFFPIIAEGVREACADDWTAAMEEGWRCTLADLNVYVAHPEMSA